MTFLRNNNGDVVNLEKIDSVRLATIFGKRIAYVHTQGGITTEIEINKDDGLEKLVALLNQITTRWLHIDHLILKVNNIDAIRYDKKVGFQVTMCGGHRYVIHAKTQEEFQQYDKQLKEGLLIETL